MSRKTLFTGRAAPQHISYAALGTTLTQLFPVRPRYSGIALSANIAGVEGRLSVVEKKGLERTG
ncbi:hypothetical protein QFZ50_001556 [Arthrobacter agilis]|nr:hypothetical protein [Arthrobacter agilis]